MNLRLSQKIAFACALAFFNFAGATPVYACAVCFGDPDSPMSKGLFMGMAVLFGVISTVLFGIAGTTMFWMHRAKQVRFQQENPSTNS